MGVAEVCWKGSGFKQVHVEFGGKKFAVLRSLEGLTAFPMDGESTGSLRSFEEISCRVDHIEASTPEGAFVAVCGGCPRRWSAQCWFRR